MIATKFVKTLTVPICKTCKHLAMDPSRPTDYLFAKCLRFGEISKLSGEVKYLYADRCRRDYVLCGTEARFHEPI